MAIEEEVKEVRMFSVGIKCFHGNKYVLIGIEWFLMIIKNVSN
jgi:hypothetical protein